MPKPKDDSIENTLQRAATKAAIHKAIDASNEDSLVVVLIHDRAKRGFYYNDFGHPDDRVSEVWGLLHYGLNYADRLFNALDETAAESDGDQP